MLLAALALLPLGNPTAPATTPPAELLGQWESADRTAEGVGNILEFRADGRVTQISASMAEADYRLVDDRLITTWKDLATGKISEVETHVEFEGSNRFLEKSDTADAADSWSERVGPSASFAGSPLVGQWCGNFLELLPSFREFKDGRMYNRLPVVVLRGRRHSNSENGSSMSRRNSFSRTVTARPASKRSHSARGSPNAISTPCARASPRC